MTKDQKVIKYCYDKMPVQTFLESKRLAFEKMLDEQYLTEKGDEKNCM